MLRLNEKIRLHPSEERVFSILTGDRSVPSTVAEYNRSLELARAACQGDSPEEKLLQHIIENLET